MGFEAAAALGALGLAFIALGLSITHALRCPVEQALGGALEECEASVRKCKALLAEAENTAEQIGRRNSRMAAERSKLERAHRARVEDPAAEKPNGAADDAWMIRLLTSADLTD
jgi:hypothetical protein